MTNLMCYVRKWYGGVCGITSSLVNSKIKNKFTEKNFFFNWTITLKKLISYIN